MRQEIVASWLGYAVLEEFVLFPVVLLDTVGVSWQRETGNGLLAHYKVSYTSRLYAMITRTTRAVLHSGSMYVILISVMSNEDSHGCIGRMVSQ